MKTAVSALNESELENICGGAISVKEASSVLMDCLKSEDHSVVYNGIRFEMFFDGSVAVAGDHVPVLLNDIIQSVSSAKFVSGGIGCTSHVEGRYDGNSISIHATKVA